MKHGDIMILQGKVHGFINTTIIWYDRPDEPDICFRQFPSREAVEAFAEANQLTVLDEPAAVTNFEDVEVGGDRFSRD